MTTAEYKVKLFLEQNLTAPVLTYFDPVILMNASPIFISEQLIDTAIEWYTEYARRFTVIDTYYLYKLSHEAGIKNIALNRLFDKKEVAKKLSLFFTLYKDEAFAHTTGVEYFKKYPTGRVRHHM